jgi:hypothetical protein
VWHQPQDGRVWKLCIAFAILGQVQHIKGQEPFRITHTQIHKVQLGLHLCRLLGTCNAIREQKAQGLRSRVPTAPNIAIVVYAIRVAEAQSTTPVVPSIALSSGRLTFINYTIWSNLLPLYNVSWRCCRDNRLHGVCPRHASRTTPPSLPDSSVFFSNM